MVLTEEQKQRVEEEEKTFLLNKNQYICTVCGFIGKPKKVTRGNFSVEVTLWLFLWWLFLLPPLIYSLWRVSNKYNVCPKCNSTVIVPIDTPNGRALLRSLQGKT